MNEEKILQAIASLAQRLDTMQAETNNRFDRLEGRFDNLEGRFDNLEGRFDNLEGRFDNLEGRFDNLEGQVKENTDIIKAILHNQEHAHAKLEALEMATATAESVRRLDAKVDVLNNRLFQQEAEMHQLRLIK